MAFGRHNLSGYEKRNDLTEGRTPMIRFRRVLALFKRLEEREDRTLARFGQLETVRQATERPPVPLFLARKPRLA